MDTTRRCTALLMLGAFGLGLTACQPTEPDAELVHSWDWSDPESPRFDTGETPWLLTTEDDVFEFFRGRGQAINFNAELIRGTLSSAAADHFLVAAGHAECTEINGVWLDEIQDAYVIRVDYSEEDPASRCRDLPPGTQIWQIPHEDTGGVQPAAIITSTTAGAETPERIGLGALYWSGEPYWHATDYYAFNQVLQGADTRLYSSSEDLSELADALEEVLKDESVAPVRNADTSDSSYVLIEYDACAGAWPEVSVNTAAEPTVVQTEVFFYQDVACAAPDPRLEVWEIPNLIIGEDTEIENRHVPLEYPSS